MNSNGKKALALLAATTLAFSMAACERSNPKPFSNDATSVCATYREDIEYTIKKGDTLYELAKEYYGEGSYWKELALYNGVKDPRRLKIGKTIFIPNDVNKLIKLCYGYKAKVHPIVKGDTLSEICYKYYDGDDSQETVWKLATYNELINPDLIIIGTDLKIPPKKVLDKVESYNYANLGEQLMILSMKL